MEKSSSLTKKTCFNYFIKHIEELISTVHWMQNTPSQIIFNVTQADEMEPLPVQMAKHAVKLFF